MQEKPSYGKHTGVGLGLAVAATCLFVSGSPSLAQRAAPVPNSPTASPQSDALPRPPTPSTDLGQKEPARIFGRRPGYWQRSRPPYRQRYPRQRRWPGGYWDWRFDQRTGSYSPYYRPYWARPWSYYRGGDPRWYGRPRWYRW